MPAAGAEPPHEALYVTNLALLATHQADAAYWHEWDVLRVPGGLPFFLVFTAAAVALLAVGLVRVARRAPSARAFARLCAGTGGLTVGLHAAVFALHDRTAFATPASLGLLAAVAVTSVAQAIAARRLGAPAA